jgi:4-amino-4-deoxy-L-arabinose transferase-like glycosyltransferase
MSEPGADAAPGPSARTAWLLLAPILALGIGLRAWNLDFGLPDVQHADEPNLVEAALKVADPRRASLDPGFYAYPSLSMYVLAAVFYAGGVLAGGSAAHPALPAGGDAAFVARVVTAAFAVATIVAVYALGAAWRSRATGLLAALFLAVAPIAVLHPHYANVDVPMVFWETVALALAIRCLDGGRRRDLLLAAAAMGLAGASKYTCLLMAAALPVLAWLASRGADRRVRRTVAWTLAAAAVLALAFVAAAPYTLIRFDDVWRRVRWERAHVAGAHFGFDVNAGGLPYVPVVYQLLVGLPFALGLLLYPSALVGAVAAFRRRDRTRWLVLGAAVGPVAAVVLLARVVFPRYLLPLVPVAALAAALGVTTLWNGGRRAGRVLAAAWVVLVVAHTVLYTGSLVAALHPHAPVEAARWIRHNVPRGDEIGVVVSRKWPALLGERYRLRRVTIHEPLATGGPDWLVVNAWASRPWERGDLVREPAHAFFEELGASGSAYELAAAFTSEYLHEPFFGWLDPNLRNQYESPDMYVYRRRRR